MNSKKRTSLLKKLSENETIIKKIANELDSQNVENGKEYSDKLFEKLLSEIKIPGLED